MTPEITQLERTILLAAFDDMERLRRGKEIPGVSGWHAIQNGKAEAERNMVRFATARWVGQTRLSSKERMAVTRAIDRLIQRGLAGRALSEWSEERATYLHITDEGKKLARRMRRESKAEPASNG